MKIKVDINVSMEIDVEIKDSDTLLDNKIRTIHVAEQYFKEYCPDDNDVRVTRVNKIHIVC